MANQLLTKKDLLKMTKVIINLVKVSTKQRIDLLEEGLINNNQNAFIFNEEVKLLNEANKAAQSVYLKSGFIDEGTRFTGRSGVQIAMCLRVS